MDLAATFAALDRLPAEHAQLRTLAPHVWHITHRPQPDQPCQKIILSVGIHGNETTPVHLVARRLAHWLRPESHNTDLLLIAGNPAALASNTRFTSFDLNRLFGPSIPDSMPAGAWENTRAEKLKAAVHDFLHLPVNDQQVTNNWPVIHLDLHTTIRPSLKNTFAIVPVTELPVNGSSQNILLRLLTHAGIEAAVLNTGPSPTFSAFTARYQVLSATLELGQVPSSAETADLTPFLPVQAMLDQLFKSGVSSFVRQPLPPGPEMVLYQVVNDIRKTAHGFQMQLSAAAPNFSGFHAGEIIATDDAGLKVIATTGDEAILFPNPGVAPGLRAGLLVRPL